MADEQRRVSKASVDMLQHIPKDRYRSFSRIGQGGFGYVYKAWDKGRQEFCALKQLKGQEHQSELQKEGRNMKFGQDEYVINLHGFTLFDFEEETNIRGLVMPFMPQGSLKDLLGRSDIGVPWALRVRFMLQIARGMNCLHLLSPPLLHLDLKPGNVLLTESLDVRLADFGLSSMGESDAATSTTFTHAPPEWTRKTKLTTKFDVYSYGILLWEILTEKEPYRQYDGSDPDRFLVTSRVKKGKRPDTIHTVGDGRSYVQVALPTNVNAKYRIQETVIPLMRQCWAQQPNERPEFTAVVGKLKDLADGLALEAQADVQIIKDTPDLTILDLQTELRKCLGKKLKEWEGESSVGETELRYGGYVEQQIKADRLGESRDNLENLRVSSMDELLEENCGSLIAVYAEAGLGKTTMLRNIAKRWQKNGKDDRISGLYDLAFLLPLRHRRPGESIVDVVCQMGLISQKCKGRLKQVLNMPTKKALFLLDSFEEVPQKDVTQDLTCLIRREEYVKQTVVVTSRPGSRLEGLQQDISPRIVAHLQILPADEVKQYIQNWNLSADAKKSIGNLGIDFLRKPINLTLACSLWSKLQQDEKSGRLELKTRTQLFSRLLQHYIQVYVTKKNMEEGKEFSSTTGSPLKNRDIPRDARRFVKDIGDLCLDAMFKSEETHWLNVEDSDFIRKVDLREFGLFSDGPEDNLIGVPHLLFMEYLAATYIVADKRAWKILRVEIEQKLKDLQKEAQTDDCPLCLEHVLSSLAPGLPNVIRFAVGLGLKIESVRELAQLFAIKRCKVLTTTGADLQSQMQYELDLLDECIDQDVHVQAAMATALLDAPGFTDTSRGSIVQNRQADKLLKFGDKEQHLAFLQKTYGCELRGAFGSSKLSHLSDEKHQGFLWDCYAVRCVEKYHLDIKMKELHVVHSDVPVALLPRLTSRLSVFDCEHCSLVWDEASEVPASARTASHPTSKMELKMFEVKHLKVLRHVRLPCLRHLKLKSCDDVDLNAVSASCAQLEQLEMAKCMVLVGDTTHSLKTLRILKLWEFSHLEKAGRWLRETEARRALQELAPLADIDIRKYKYRPPQCALKGERLKTFSDFPSDVPQSGAELAVAGFYFTGTTDKVQCFYCNIKLDNWQSFDEPWERHAYESPKCEHVLKMVQTKEKNYVQKVAEKFDTVLLASKQCTFAITQKFARKQPLRRCHTCQWTVCCQTCVELCHKGHEVEEAKYRFAYCHCGHRDKGPCQAAATVSSASAVTRK